MQYAQCVKNISYNIAQNISCILYNTYNIICTILYTLFFVYCTNCTYCTYCANRTNFVHIVHYCTCLYDILYKIVIWYCVQNCTLLHSIIYKIVHCKAPLARCPPAAPAPAQADCFACVASPHPFCRPRRVSCNALPLQITGARFTFQNRASCAEQVRPTQVRRRRQLLVAARR